MAELVRWFRLVRFSHTLFALPFAVVGYAYALVQPGVSFSWRVLILVLLCMVFARSAAMAYNRVVDRRIDAQNPRTESREIPAGVITVRDARRFVLVNAIGFVACCYLLNRLVFYLSPVALFVIFFYSHTKRFSSLCHLWLGLGLGLAPLGAFIAVSGHFAAGPVFLGVGVMLWTAAFDAVYSIQDKEFDQTHGLHSLPVRLGPRGAFGVAVTLMVLSLLSLFLALRGMESASALRWVALGLFALVVVGQFVTVVLRWGRAGWLDSSFMTVNGVNSLLFGCLVTLSLLV